MKHVQGFMRSSFAPHQKESPLIDTHIVFSKQAFFYTFRDFSFLRGSFVGL